MEDRRLGFAVRVWLCVVAGVFVFSVAPAMAKTFHKYEAQITGVPTEGPHGEQIPSPEQVALPGPPSEWPFDELNSMTVDSGDLFVAEKVARGDRLDEFDASTLQFIAQFPQPAPQPEFNDYKGVAVGDVTGKRQVYVGQEQGDVAVFGETSANVWSFLGLWTGPEPGVNFGSVRGVAVDDSQAPGDWASGDVYVSTGENHVVDVLKPEADGHETLVTKLEGPEPGKPFAHAGVITVNQANGDVLVYNSNETVTGSPGKQVKHYERSVDVFEPEANMEGVFKLSLTLTGPTPGSSFEEEIHGIAVDGDSGLGANDIYVAENAETVETPAAPRTKADLVREFSPSGEPVDTITGKETPAGSLSDAESVAVDPASGRVLIGSRHEGIVGEPESSALDVYGRLQIVPDVTTKPVSNVKFEPETSGLWSARINGEVDPVDAGDVTSCEFAWGTSSSFGQLAQCTAVSEGKAIANGDSFVPVHANLTSLEPDTTYSYRLQAGNANGTNEGEPSQTVQFTTPGPGMDGQSVSEVTSSSATLEAVVNPHLDATSYFFQYGTTSGYGSEAPVLSASAPAGASAGSGEGEVTVPQHVQGLQKHTLYHYRVVVTSEVEVSPGKREALVFHGPDETFTTRTGGGTLTLLDGRAWEQVSPPDKHGGQIFGLVKGAGQTAPTQASSDGRGMTFGVFVPGEEGPQGYVNEPQGYITVAPILSTRGVNGWSSTDMTAPRDAPRRGLTFTPEFQFVSEDLSRSFFVQLGGGDMLLSGEASELTPYVRNQPACAPDPSAPGCYVPVLSGREGYADVLGLGKEFGQAVGHELISLMGATPDLAHVLLKSTVALTEAPVAGEELYEWSASEPPDEALQLVSVLPAGEGGAGGAPDPHEGVSAGTDPSFDMTGARNTLSGDGSRVFWTDEDGNSSHHLYMRDMAKKETIRLDLPQEGALGSGTAQPRFQFANSAGSKVFFTDPQRLTADSGKDTLAEFGDLYECEIVEEEGKDACKLSDLTPETDGESAGMQKMLSGASEDGSYLYFVANGALAPGASRGDCLSQSAPGATCNLYMSHDGKLTFIATLSGDDENDWGSINEVYENLGLLTARASTNGRYFAFMSDRSLTGYDNRDARSGKPDEEVYLYDAESDKLVCASCNPTGARPVGVEVKQAEEGPDLASVSVPTAEQHFEQVWVAASIPSGDSLSQFGQSLYQPRYLSNEGRLFFDSDDALVPLDINGNEDVYEYEPAGVGPSGTGCTPSSSSYDENAGGCVDLISSGTSSEESGFLDASESGNDVFFLTAEKLVPQDVDTALDVYDARVCSAEEPCESAPSVPPPCVTAEACKGGSAPQPEAFGSPASATFSGLGNVIVASGKSAVGAKSPTRAEKLRRALRACAKEKAGRKRAGCERRAHKRYGPSKAKAKSNASAKRGKRG